MTASRPTVTLKIATSLDGRIATASGESRWITGEAAREEVHRLRAAHDAVLVGSQTVLDDDPELTVRLPGYDGPQPLRVVADGRLRTPPTAKVLAGDALLITRAGRSTEDLTRFLERHAERAASRPLSRPDAPVRPGAFFQVAPCSENSLGEGLDPMGILDAVRASSDALHRRTERAPAVLLEGGGKLAASFMRAGLIDRIEWFRAPIVLGGDARPALAALELGKLADAPRWKRLDVRTLGDDLWERYERLQD
jgi:diaminohydroxyphosphoribosylaminopyrimidine deaminase/5-amino-6-(5-phosphoribosylamino)uracil reductase